MATLASQIMTATIKALQQKVKSKAQGYQPISVDGGAVTVRLVPSASPLGLTGYVTYTQEVESPEEAGRSSVDEVQADAGTFSLPLSAPLKGNADDFPILQELLGLLAKPVKHFRGLDNVVRLIPPPGKRRVQARRSKGSGFGGFAKTDDVDDLLYGLESKIIAHAAKLAEATTTANVGYSSRAAIGDTPPEHVWDSAAQAAAGGAFLPPEYLRFLGLNPDTNQPLTTMLPKGMIPRKCPCGGGGDKPCTC